MDGICIRTARPEDARRLLEIYGYYVENTAISFETRTPTEQDFRARIQNTLRRYPYLVLEKEGRIQGYAYAGPFKERAAYDWACELSVYLDPAARKQGYGRALYEALEEALRKMGLLNLYACIASPETEDRYLDKNSEAFHAHMGFVRVGEFHRCGYKFGRWYNMIWMEKRLGTVSHPQPPVWFPESL